MGRRNDIDHNHDDEQASAATSATLFGMLLRDHRTKAGLSQEELAGKIPCDRSLVAKVEAGVRVPQLPFVMRCDEVLGTGGLMTRLWPKVNWYQRVDHPDWFQRRADMDAEATALRIYQSQFMPGLLQSDEYAHALLTPNLGGDLGQGWAAARLSRQQRFLDADGPLLMVVLDESALRNVVGGPSIMRNQCAHLLATAQYPNIRIQVAPARLALDLPATSVSLITLPDGHQWVYSESLDRGHFCDDPIVYARHARTYDVLRADALSVSESASLISDFMEGYSGDGTQRRIDGLGQEQPQRPQRRRLPRSRVPDDGLGQEQPQRSQRRRLPRSRPRIYMRHHYRRAR
ncbi:Scr1 family TA system antitoxin-like transcriptional regulator [Streptomyces sp. NPDC017979]|uniref:helix-turn-helix domain-containing protein n=1 Tax=Streptomyces sp. NPDC017979 TaxID=3365024 RepID=UPI0037A29D3F